MSVIRKIFIATFLILMAITNANAEKQTLTYNVTGGAGLVTSFGMQTNTPVDAKGQVHFHPIDDDSFNMDIKPITSKLIKMTYRDGVWFGRHDSWAGMRMNIMVKAFRIGTQKVTIKLIGKSKVAKLEMTIQAERDEESSLPEPNEETPSEENKPKTDQGGANKPAKVLPACDLLDEIETKARELDNKVLLSRMGWIIEKKGLYDKKPLTNRMCDTALEHIEKESILDILQDKYGRETGWPKDNKSSTGKANCDRLERVEKRLHELKNDYASDRYAQIKAENGITDLQSASDQACAAVFEQVKRESVEDAVRKAWTPEPLSNNALKKTKMPEKPKVQLGDPISRPANTCDRLMKITEKSRESGNVFIYQRVRKIMEDLGLIKEAIPNEAECRAALHEIDKSGVVEGLEKRFGPEAQWQDPNNEANNKTPAVIIKDPLLPKPSNKNEAKPSCDRLKRVEAQARRSSDPFVTGLIALVKEEQGFVLGQHHSNEQCQKVIDEINKEAAIPYLESEFGPEDSWKTSAGTRLKPKLKSNVVEKNYDSDCGRMEKIEDKARESGDLFLMKLIYEIKEKEGFYRENVFISNGGCVAAHAEFKKQGIIAALEKQYGPEENWKFNGISKDTVGSKSVNSNCKELRQKSALILRGSDKVAMSNLRSAFKQARLLDIGKATAAQCNQVLDALGMPTSPIIGDVTNGAQNPMPNSGKQSLNNGLNGAPKLAPSNQKKQKAQTPPKPQKAPNNQQAGSKQPKKSMIKIIANTSKSMAKTNWCGPANNAIIKIVARGSAPEMKHVSELLNYYQVTNLFTAERMVCEQIFNNLKMNGLVK